MLLNFIIDQIYGILHEVKHKLIVKAVEVFDLLHPVMQSDTKGAPDGPIMPSDKMIKDYPECPLAFD